jgi:hypothetical protein
LKKFFAPLRLSGATLAGRIGAKASIFIGLGVYVVLTISTYYRHLLHCWSSCAHLVNVEEGQAAAQN